MKMLYNIGRHTKERLRDQHLGHSRGPFVFMVFCYCLFDCLVYCLYDFLIVCLDVLFAFGLVKWAILWPASWPPQRIGGG